MYDWLYRILAVGGIFFILLFVIFIIAIIIAYVMVSIGLYGAAQKRGIAYPWMAWIPIVRCYLIGLMLKNELAVTSKLKIPYFQFVFPACQIIAWLGSGSFLGTLFSIISFFVVILAFIALFRQYGEPNAILYGILAGVPVLEIVGSFFVYQLAEKPAPDLATDTTVFPGA